MPVLALEDKLAERIDFFAPGGCWQWTGELMALGYGRIHVKGYPLAHRAVYETFVEAVPEGLELDHLCRNTGCVNPDHLEPVTHAENMRRGVWPNRSKTHCPRGHLYDYFYQQERGCRTCRTEAMRRYRARQNGAD